MRRALIAALALLLAAPVFAAETNPIGLKLTVVPLVFKVVELNRVIESAKEVTIELPGDVLFDFDKSNIRPDAADALKQAAGILKARAKGPVRVEGHTDAKGNAAYNQKLSEARANAVKKWLMEKEGLSAMNFTTKGFGATKPTAPNTKPDGSDNPDGRQKNRRVALVFAKSG
jgi:outer membrane protein OmpA-like peptidoglycan-associated protein